MPFAPRCAFVSCLILAVAGPSVAGAQDAPRRIASASLCADAYLAALAKPETVVAVSWQADDPIALTPTAWAGRPKAWRSAERLLALGADLVVLGPGETPRQADLLTRFDQDVVTLDWAEDFAGVRANLRRLGQATGREAAGEALIADLDARLDALAERASARGWTPSVLYLTPTAGTAGRGAFVDAAIEAAGGRNAAAESGVEGWGRLGFERLLTLSPDLIATSYFNPGYFSVADRARRSTGFARRLEADDAPPRIEVPAGLWPCAAPTLVDAAEAIADALDALPSEAS